MTMLGRVGGGDEGGLSLPKQRPCFKQAQPKSFSRKETLENVKASRYIKLLFVFISNFSQYILLCWISMLLNYIYCVGLIYYQININM
jgi:hypothetical protein